MRKKWFAWTLIFALVMGLCPVAMAASPTQQADGLTDDIGALLEVSEGSGTTPSSTPEVSPETTPSSTPEVSQTPETTPTPQPSQEPEPSPAPSPEPSPEPVSLAPTVTQNINRQNYSNGRYDYCADTVTSHLYENVQGGVTRVEYTGEAVIAEEYDKDFTLRASHQFSMELPLWGGFFAGAKYNFLVFGQENKEQKDDLEVVRVVKYDKDWNRLGQASLRGANTYIPFDAGSLRFAEYEGSLYIRTCHEMYASGDGLHHQANMTILVDEQTMKVADAYYIVMNSSVGYVSHSFNQFVLVDSEQNIVTADHGDAHPRALVVMRYNAKAGTGKFSGSVDGSTLVSFPTGEDGSHGYNYTGGSIGGLAETQTGYVTAYNFDGAGLSTEPRTVYLGYTAKDGLASTSTALGQPGTSTPMLAPTGMQGGYILWNTTEGAGGSGWYQAENVTDTLCYAPYSADGTVGKLSTATASLSDCQPILYNGKILWYVTDNSAPVFYSLDDSGVTAHAVPTPVTGISLDRKTVNLDKGETVTLHASITPDNATSKGVYWVSSDTSVATVKNGTVTAVKAGTATITARTKEGDFSASCKVTVNENLVTWISISGAGMVKEGHTISLWATVSPSNADDQTIRWSSSNTSVLKLASRSGNNTTQSGDSIIFKGVSAGTATVTAQATDGSGVKDTWRVTVTSEPSDDSSGSSGGGSSSGGGGGGSTGGGSSSGGGSSTTTPTGGSSTGSGSTTTTPTGGSSSGGSTTTAPTGGSSTTTPPTVTINGVTFVDVAVGSWYEDAVIFAVENDLFQGVGNNCFAPEGTMTRAMLMTVLARLDGQDTTGGAVWYEKGMTWAMDHGISDGTNPNGNITREQLAAMLYRYGAKGNRASGGRSYRDFTDGHQVSAWAQEAMEWAVRQGVITGKSGGVLDPQGNATRAEVATMIQRYVNLGR